jgi:hypothetical protein
MDTTQGGEATAPLPIKVTADASETLTWRTLARQAVPMLERPEQFHIAQRKQLAQTLSLLLNGDLELEHVCGDARDEYEPERFDEDPNSDSRKEPW